MQLRAGTSGFSYTGWKGSFYPEKAKPADFLSLYAERLPAVEINNTFYRMPNRETLETWASRVPESFRFALKAPRRITHQKRLANAEEDTDFLLIQLDALGARLGALLFQLPPSLRVDRPRLERFLDHLAGRVPTAFEFRHASWREDDVVDLLRARGVALVAAETDTDTPELRATAPFGYLRLRRSDYTPEDLAAWLDRLRPMNWDEAYVFFKHSEESAQSALNAEAFLELATAS